MKAVYIERCGGPEVLIYGDMPDPVPAADDVLIDIAAASVNATDWKARASGYAKIPFPHIMGRDLSGTVSGVGKDVDQFKVGDEVFAVCMR
jgi:NADPH:quinone reductase-like Zn-dependent oxidoreductase